MDPQRYGVVRLEPPSTAPPLPAPHRPVIFLAQAKSDASSTRSPETVRYDEGQHLLNDPLGFLVDAGHDIGFEPHDDTTPVRMTITRLNGHRHAYMAHHTALISIHREKDAIVVGCMHYKHAADE